MRKIALLLLFVSPAGLLAQTPEEERDRSFLSDLIEGYLTSDDQVVRIDGFRGALSSEATVSRLSIADADGEWLIARDLVLDWNRSALFDRRLEVERLAAGSIEFLRAPEGDAPPPAPEAVPFALPQLPVSIDIGELAVDRITLGEALIGQEVNLTLAGTAQLAGGAGTAALTAERIDGPLGRFALTGGFSNETRILSLDLDLTEGPGGLTSTLLDLPGDPSLELTVTGTAPIDDYESTLRLASDGEERVTGRFLLGAAPDDEGRVERNFTLELQGDVTALIAQDYREFFGNDLGLTLTGRREGDGSFDVSALDINAQAVRLAGSARIAPSGWPERFALTGDLGLAGGGPVTLPLGGDPVTVTAMDLDLSYDQAAGDAWTGRFVMRDLDGAGYTVPALQLTGGGTIQPEDGAFTVAMDYAASNLALDDPALARAIGSRVEGAIRAGRNDGPFVIEALTLNGPGLAADLSGEIGSASDALPYDLALTLSAEDLSRFDLLTGLDLGGAADLTVTATGSAIERSFAVTASGGTTDLTLGIPEADALLGGEGEVSLALTRDATGFRLDRAAIQTRALTANGSATLTSGDSEGGFSLVLDDVARVAPGLSGPAELTGDFTNGSDSGLAVTAAARLPGALADFTATRPAGGTATALDLTATIPALAAFAEAAGLDLTGSADLTVTGTLAEEMDLTLAARTRDLGFGIAQADAVLAGDGDIDARITRDAQGVLRIEGLEIDTRLLDGSGDVVVREGRTEAGFDLSLREIRDLAEGLSGPARLTGSVTRAPEGALTLDVAANAMGAQAKVEGVLDAGTFLGQFGAAVADLRSLAPLIGQDLRGGAEIAANGRISTDLADIDLTLSGATRDLDAGIPQLAPLLAGDGVIGGQIRRTGGDSFIIEGASLATPGLRLALTGDTDGAAANGDVTLVLPRLELIAPGYPGTGTLAGRVERAATGALTLALTGSAPGTTLSLEASSDGDDPMAGMTGDLRLSASDLGVFSTLAGQSLGGRLDLAATGRVVPRGLGLDLTVDATTQSLDPGNASLARLLAGTGTLRAEVLRPPEGALILPALNVAFPNLTVTGTAEEAPGGASARFDARLADIGLFTPEFSGPATASGTARLNDGTWSVDAAVTGPGGIGADIDGSIAPGGAMDLAASGTLPLGLANGFLEPRRIRGEAGFDLRLNGQPALENLTGTVRTSGAQVADPTLGLSISDLSGTVALAGGSANLDLGANVDGGGRLTVSGGIGLTGGMVADLTLTGTEVTHRDPELYETSASGVIRVTGPLSGGALISGQVDLGVTEVRIPSSGVGSLGDLPNVTHIGTPGRVAETLARAGLTTNGAPAAGGGGGGTPFALDLFINAPSRVFIRGRGLDAELGGSLRIGGTTAQVVPSGGLELIRGRLDILQQRFVLTEGRADIQGDFIPWLRLVAETESRSGVAVSVIVEGPATAPDVSFRSSPELPQDEVLAQLLFGRDLTSISPLQAVQLAAAVGTLAGTGGGGIIGSLRTGLGVDDFDLVTDDQGGTALRLGAYLSENVYTDVTVGQETSVNLNLDLTSDITVTGSVSTEGQTSLGIYFERDY